MIIKAIFLSAINNLFNSIKNNNSISSGNYLFLLYLFIVLFFKIGVDIVFYTLNLFDSNLYIALDYVNKIIFILFLFIFNAKKTKVIYNQTRSKDDVQQKQKFFNEYLEISLIVLVVIGLKYLIFSNIYEGYSIYIYRDWRFVAILNFLFFISAIVSMRMIFFIFRWFILRKNKYTNKAIGFGISIVAFTYTVALFNIYHNEFIEFIILCLYFILIVFIFIASKIYNWLSTISTLKKIGLLCASLISIVFTIGNLLYIYDQIVFESSVNIRLIHSFSYLSFLIFSYIIFLEYSLIILFTTILSLPTAKVIDKKTNELMAISNIYKSIISIETDIDLTTDITLLNDQKYFEKILKNAKLATDAQTIWCEFYFIEKEVDVRFCEGELSIAEIQKLHNKTDFKQELLKINVPIIIETLLSYESFSFLQKITTDIASMAIIPIIYKKQRIGTVVLVDKDEYKFDSESLTLMQTFFDIINVIYFNIINTINSIELKKELELGQEVQKKLLPTYLPEIQGYSIQPYYKAAKEVGGDYYDFVKLADSRDCIIIGDVSGKGISAAFIMSYLKGIVISLASQANSPKELLELINTYIKKNRVLDKSMFITMTAFCINDKDGNIVFARAGHVPLLAKINNKCSYYMPNGIGILSCVDDEQFNNTLEEQTLKLNKGDICILFTDGVNEAINERNEEFSFNNLKLFVQNYILKGKELNNTASDVTLEIVNQLNKFKGNIESNDDITIVTIVYTG